MMLLQIFDVLSSTMCNAESESELATNEEDGLHVPVSQSEAAASQNRAAAKAKPLAGTVQSQVGHSRTIDGLPVSLSSGPEGLMDELEDCCASLHHVCRCLETMLAAGKTSQC